MYIRGTVLSCNKGSCRGLARGEGEVTQAIKRPDFDGCICEGVESQKVA